MPAVSTPQPPRRDTVVLLVDDQPIIGEAVRRMLVGEADITLHYCREAGAAHALAATIRPTVILQDLVMPDIDGLQLVDAFRADPRLRDVPIVVLSTKEEPAVKAEAFARGANDYIVKLPDRLELLARLRHHSRGYVALVERNEAFLALQASRQALADDLATAAAYVRSLLPPPCSFGPVAADWRFFPSAALGGDAFGFHTLDEDHLAMYLLDVCGHGVGAALLSVSALSAIRNGALPRTDFRDPAAVLGALNMSFPMERHNDMFFTLWYGVYRLSTRTLRWAGGGHPPGVLFEPGARARPVRLESQGPLIGVVGSLEFEASQTEVPPGSTLFLYSDGAFEVTRPDGSMWGFEDFLTTLADSIPSAGGPPSLDAFVARARAEAGQEEFADDLAVLGLAFA